VLKSSKIGRAGKSGMLQVESIRVMNDLSVCCGNQISDNSFESLCSMARNIKAIRSIFKRSTLCVLLFDVSVQKH
jgi:hypothetical protein